MAVVAMQKVAILAHKSCKEELLEALHHEGVVQVTEQPAGEKIDHTEVAFRVAELEFAIDTLKNFASKETQVAAAKQVSEESILSAAKHTDVRGIVDTLHALEASDTEIERELQEQNSLYDTFTPWCNLPYKLEASTESKTTVWQLGSVPTAQLDALLHVLQTTLPRTDILQVQSMNGNTTAVAHVWKADYSQFEEIATSYGWTNETLPTVAGTPSSITEGAITRIKELQRQLKKNHDERVRLSVELPNLGKVRTFMRWLDEKQEVREAMGETISTLTLLGWMPKKSVTIIENRLQKISPAIVILPVKADANEEPPVLLKHATWAAPFQSVTTLYGLPLPFEMDPTASLAPFFTLFFALCLTDAGYGLVLTLLFGGALLKTRVAPKDAPLLWTLFISGVATFIVGILFGGWFGLQPAAMPEFLTKTTADGELLFKGQIWNLGTQAGIGFLQNLSLALGITHLFFGMFLAGWHKWVHGQKAAALWQDFTSHIFLAAAIFMIVAPESMAGIAKYSFFAALIAIIWGKGYGNPFYTRPIFGALGLMNFAIGLLSNGLSYLRILALGLVTGAIAMAVNQVAVEMGKLFPAWLGIPVIILIFTGGHLVSIALNTLGSFIHSGRLQFIEFFGQFFEGGGQPFAPFKRSSNS